VFSETILVPTRKVSEIQCNSRSADAERLTKQEQNAFDYFNGQNFYRYHQSLETLPNIFDIRLRFLLKVDKNKNMREDFLKSYNQRKSEN